MNRVTIHLPASTIELRDLTNQQIAELELSPQEDCGAIVWESPRLVIRREAVVAVQVTVD